MRTLMILCFISFTMALPQGYNYNQPNQLSTSIGNGISIPTLSKSITNGITSPGGFLNPPLRQSQQQAIISKHYYIHSAPEESEDELRQQIINVGQPRKHYNVVFIRTPNQLSKAAALSLAQAQTEEKTVIYVLTKKTDPSDIQSALQVAPTQPSKPEVFFIKYKTPEEAQHAQHQIQAQYEALGGSTQISDEGIAPVSSVIGSAGGGNGISSNSISSSSSSGNIGGPAYLPPIRRI